MSKQINNRKQKFMRYVCTSDLHGALPEIPECDVLLLGGDICPVSNHRLDFQQSWLDTDFRYWLKRIPAKKIIGCVGNHDLIFQEKPNWVPKDLPWTYLEDSGIKHKELNIYGSPWQPIFFLVGI